MFNYETYTQQKGIDNTWKTTVGSVIAGEDSFEAVLREAKKEIGINLFILISYLK
ncbi:NUDIX domain-containing protein [Clostridium sp.]|uniref:NUDIX domain-containing protein n=1 Tax=Clostridium sp. TaxID=1506 RepID=UPI0037C081AE